MFTIIYELNFFPWVLHIFSEVQYSIICWRKCKTWSRYYVRQEHVNLTTGTSGINFSQLIPFCFCPVPTSKSDMELLRRLVLPLTQRQEGSATLSVSTRFRAWPPPEPPPASNRSIPGSHRPGIGSGELLRADSQHVHRAIFLLHAPHTLLSLMN